MLTAGARACAGGYSPDDGPLASRPGRRWQAAKLRLIAKSECRERNCRLESGAGRCHLSVMAHPLRLLGRVIGLPLAAYTSAARLWLGAAVLAGGLAALLAGRGI